MSELTNRYKLSLYKTLTVLNNNCKSVVELVQDIRDEKIYIKKTLTNYNLEVYKQLEKLSEEKSINIPKIYELIEIEDNKLIVIEEFINGKTLEEISRKQTLNEETVIRYVIKLCIILEKLHGLENPIIHRDIKPSNIIIDNNNILKLIDFDVSRVYKENENRDTRILGTEGYAAPEQFGFQQTDKRSDIYSIGVLLNVLTVGEFPRDNKSNGKLGIIIEKCTRISPDERYNSVTELKEELLKCINNESFKKKEHRKGILNNIPGFKERKIPFMILSGMWYSFLMIGFCMNLSSGDKDLILTDIIAVTSLLILTFLYGDFYNIQEYIPLLKSKNPLKRILGFILYTVIILYIVGVLTPKVS